MVLIGLDRGIGRRVAALTGAFAILLQAILFAWHHHEVSFHVRSAGAVTILLAPPTSPAAPGLADHDCEICFALSHHGAVPIGLFVANPPVHELLRRSRLAQVRASPAPYILFRSRAPPLA
jgi:hypothetical protein